jgi:hypothetical protein
MEAGSWARRGPELASFARACPELVEGRVARLPMQLLSVLHKPLRMRCGAPALGIEEYPVDPRFTFT